MLKILLFLCYSTFIVNSDILRVSDCISTLLLQSSYDNDFKVFSYRIDSSNLVFLYSILIYSISYFFKLLMFFVGLFTFVPFHVNLSTRKKVKCNHRFLSTSTLKYVFITVICSFIWYDPHSPLFCTGFLNQMT